MAVTFDLFGTLVSVDRPSEPAAAVADELRARGVAVPADWSAAYREQHVAVPPGGEVSLPEHVSAALRSRGVAATEEVVDEAVSVAFEPVVTTRPGAEMAVQAARERGPVGILSNVSVRGLAERTLAESALDPSLFDAVVTSVGCGFRKPDRGAFEAAAAALGVPVSDLIHVGDDPETDGGAEAVGATFVDVADVPLSAIPEWLAEDGRDESSTARSDVVLDSGGGPDSDEGPDSDGDPEGER